jgi:hypothetical protein
MKLVPLLHIAIYGDGSIQDVTAMSTVDSFGVNSKVEARGECDLILYGLPVDSSPINELQRELGMPYYGEVKMYRAGYDTSPYAIQVEDPTSLPMWRRKIGKKWSNDYVTSREMRSWVAANYFRGSGFIGGNPSGQTHRSHRTNAAKAEWYPIYFSTIKGIADVASRIAPVVLGNADLLETSGLSYQKGTIDLCQVLDIKDIIKEYTSKSCEEYSDTIGSRNLPKTDESNRYPEYVKSLYGNEHGRTMEMSLKALKPAFSTFDTPYYVAEDLPSAYLLATRLWFFRESGYSYGVNNPHKDIAVKELSRRMHIIASSYDPVIDTVSFSILSQLMSTIEYPDGQGSIWNLLKGTDQANMVLSVLDKNLSSMRIFNKTLKKNKGILFRDKGHTKAAEREYRGLHRKSLEDHRPLEFEGFNKVHSYWSNHMRSILGDTNLQVLPSPLEKELMWHGAVSRVHYYTRKGGMGELLLCYCDLLGEYSTRHKYVSPRNVVGFEQVNGACYTRQLSSCSNISPYAFGGTGTLLPRQDIGNHMEEILSGSHGLVDLTEPEMQRVNMYLSKIKDGSIHEKLLGDAGLHGYHLILIDLKDKGYY